jgi:DNA primase
MRGPTFRSFSPGGDKALFRLAGGPGSLPRLAVVEAPIDALSLAALERIRADTLYVATTGGMGQSTVEALQELLTDLASLPDGVLVAATDADRAGERYATRLAELADAAGVRSERLVPPDRLNDWNDVVTRTAGQGVL